MGIMTFYSLTTLGVFRTPELVLGVIIFGSKLSKIGSLGCEAVFFGK
jgi:hypothetical protein